MFTDNIFDTDDELLYKKIDNKKNDREVFNIEMDNKPGTELALRIGGEAVIVAQGQMYL